MQPSPIERRALSHLERHKLPGLTALMIYQHTKGRRHYGHAIDDWNRARVLVLGEAGAELCDLLTYLERAGGVDEEIYSALRTVAVWLEGELAAHL